MVGTSFGVSSTTRPNGRSEALRSMALLRAHPIEGAAAQPGVPAGRSVVGEKEPGLREQTRTPPAPRIFSSSSKAAAAHSSTWTLWQFTPKDALPGGGGGGGGSAAIDEKFIKAVLTSR